MTTATTFPSETALCEAFKPEAFRRRWTLFGETHKWDMLVVDETGRRIGIQAKLRDPCLAIAQCKERMNRKLADVAAILVLRVGETIRRMCEAEGFGWIVPAGEPDADGYQRFTVALVIPKRPGTRCTMPLPAPRNIPCGVPSPPADFGPWQAKECLLEHLIDKHGGKINRKRRCSVGFDPKRFRLPTWLFKAEGWDRYEIVYGALVPSRKWPVDYKRTIREYEKATAKR